jgi:hypothetical protein
MLYANLEAAINRKSLNQTGGVSFLTGAKWSNTKNYRNSHRCIKDISEEERDSLIHFLCTFQEINMSVMDIPSMVHATISFILHYSENTWSQLILRKMVHVWK